MAIFTFTSRFLVDTVECLYALVGMCGGGAGGMESWGGEEAHLFICPTPAV